MARIAVKEKLSEEYGRYMPVEELDASAFIRAREIFCDYKRRGVIIKGEFEDMSWTLSNETKDYGLTLLTFEGGAKKSAMAWLGCTYGQYVKCVKAFILFNLGGLSLSSLQSMTSCFKRLAAIEGEINVRELKCGDSMWGYVATFLQMLPGENASRAELIDDLDELAAKASWSRGGNARQLADFKSYLRFDEVMTDFWRTAAERQKLFYFPLYFWWNLTAVLPLRPMEFLLTPKDCLRVQNTEQILTVRRTRLKGGGRLLGYTISDDYALKEYALSEPLADGLRAYIQRTKRYTTALDTLFAIEPHYRYLGVTIQAQYRYYTHHCLASCMNRFYSEVIEPRGHDVARIKLGDTRHLAMINLILSGGSPVICRELAGHVDISVSSHYYTNISNFVECATLERYNKIKGKGALIHGSSKYPIAPPVNAVNAEGGLCRSQIYAGGRIEDCLKVMGKNGHIGDCRYCEHYMPRTPGFTVDINDEAAAKERIDADSRYLVRMIELARKGAGFTEDIGAALLRLQHSGDRYGKLLLEKYAKGGGE